MIATPAGPLDRALAVFARQADVDVASSADNLSRIVVPAVDGRLSPAAALARLLAQTPYRAVPAGRGFRLVPAPRPAPRGQPRPVPPTQATAEEEAVVVVQASKRGASLLRYPGAALVQSLQGPLAGSTVDPTNIGEVANNIPVVQTTALGAGRDKLFVRGIADSSFTGPTQSTASVYFGDVQVGYNGPDPSLILYDVDRVEVLEGPQGALYGAGAIGGIVRLTPAAPDLSRAEGRIGLGISGVQHGAAGGVGTAMLNLPLLRGRLAVRAVGYLQRDGGYIDDPLRGLRDVNRTNTRGGRVALAGELGDGWAFEAGLVGQTIDSPDSQYASRLFPGLQRASRIAQPFDQDYLLGRLVITRHWNSGLQLLSASGVVDHHADDRFDASRATGGPLAYQTNNANRLYTQEIRLSRPGPAGTGWVTGLAFLRDHDIISRTFGMPGNPIDIVGVTNRTTSLAAFGEGTVAINRAINLTFGGRLTRARMDGDPIATRRVNAYLQGRRRTSFDPSVAASWVMAPHAAWYVRYQSGFRTGGLAVAQGIGRVANFRSDSVHVAETGWRLERAGPTGLAGMIGVSHAIWRRVQADLVDARGFPYTNNIGRGRIDGVEATIDWIPRPGLSLAAGMFLTRSKLTDAAAGLGAAEGGRLPDTPILAASATLGYSWTAARGDAFNLGITGHYEGHSQLGPAPLLRYLQGDYAEAGAKASWRRGRVTTTLAIENLTDTRGNRFALGSPFQLAGGNTYTPLRPRTFSAGVDWHW